MADRHERRGQREERLADILATAYRLPERLRNREEEAWASLHVLGYQQDLAGRPTQQDRPPVEHRNGLADPAEPEHVEMLRGCAWENAGRDVKTVNGKPINLPEGWPDNSPREAFIEEWLKGQKAKCDAEMFSEEPATGQREAASPSVDRFRNVAGLEDRPMLTPAEHQAMMVVRFFHYVDQMGQPAHDTLNAIMKQVASGERTGIHEVVQIAVAHHANPLVILALYGWLPTTPADPDKDTPLVHVCDPFAVGIYVFLVTAEQRAAFILSMT